MQHVVPHRVFDRLVLALTVLALVLPITYLEVSRPSVEQLRDFAHKIGMGVNTSSAPAVQPNATSPAQTPAPAKSNPAPTTTQAGVTGKTATTTSLVHFRASKSVDSPNIANIDAGVTVELRSDADSTWQGVRYNGKDGYIYRDYLQY